MLHSRLHSVKNNSNFEIAALFTTYTARGKGRQFQNWNYFLTEWSRSYIVFALGKVAIWRRESPGIFKMELGFILPVLILDILKNISCY